MNYAKQEREQDFAWEMLEFSKRVAAASEKRKGLCARGVHRFKLLGGHAWVNNCIRCGTEKKQPTEGGE